MTEDYIDAVSIGGAIAHAVNFYPAWVLVRPSTRSFSHWVAVFYFASRAAADNFSSNAKSEYEIPYCIVRRAGSYWVASVPVAVREVSEGGDYERFNRLPYRIFQLG
jgi:hypothetical protein